MKNGSFDSMDESLKKRLQEVPRVPVPPSMLKGFSASVAARLRQTVPDRASAPKRWVIPAMVPAFAVLALAIVAVNRMGPAATPVPYVQIASNPSAISTEIAALRELGVWTDEDEGAIGVTDEAALDELEYTGLWTAKTSEIV